MTKDGEDNAGEKGLLGLADAQLHFLGQSPRQVGHELEITPAGEAIWEHEAEQRIQTRTAHVVRSKEPSGFGGRSLQQSSKDSETLKREFVFSTSF